MIITLIGYRGSGKSTVAGPLAERLGWEFVDADAVIEARAGATIREIFAYEGEPGFRQREREVMADLLSRDKWVIAAGGGAILNAETRREMREAGPVVWLQAPIDVLWRRINGDRSTAARRPNLASGGLKEIQDLLTFREPLYRECASLSLNTAEGSLEELVERIVRHVGERESGGIHIVKSE